MREEACSKGREVRERGNERADVRLVEGLYESGRVDGCADHSLCPGDGAEGRTEGGGEGRSGHVGPSLPGPTSRHTPLDQEPTVDSHFSIAQTTRQTDIHRTQTEGKAGNLRTSFVARVREAGMGGTNATALEAIKAPRVRDRRIFSL